jgi:hypothetical protein
MSYTKADMERDSADVAFKADLATNEQLLKQTARTVTGGTYVYGYAGGDPDRMAAEMRDRGFRTEITHNGNGFKIIYR